MGKKSSPNCAVTGWVASVFSRGPGFFLAMVEALNSFYYFLSIIFPVVWVIWGMWE